MSEEYIMHREVLSFAVRRYHAATPHISLCPFPLQNKKPTTMQSALVLLISRLRKEEELPDVRA